MDCLDAQDAISEALDGATSDADVLAEARMHCQECDACMSFVRALNVVKRAPLPEPPADLPDRVMAAVRAEAAAASASFGAAAAAAAGGAPADAVSVSAPVGAAVGAAASPQAADGSATVIPISTRLKHTRPSVLAAWAGAAAVLLVGVGLVGVMGIRMMSSPPTSTTANLASAPRDSASSGQAQPQAAESAVSGEAKVATAAPESDYIVFNGSVYALVGPSTVPTSGLKQLGTTRTSLDGTDSRSREIMGADGVPGVYVVDDQGKLLAFQLVTRKYTGRNYQLKSGEIPAFGEWPVLPGEIAEPTAENGSPTFTAVGADSSGLTVYRLTSSTAAEGIAVAPGARQGAPVAGSPNWTWWTPAP